MPSLLEQLFEAIQELNQTLAHDNEAIPLIPKNAMARPESTFVSINAVPDAIIPRQHFGMFDPQLSKHQSTLKKHTCAATIFSSVGTGTSLGLYFSGLFTMNMAAQVGLIALGVAPWVISAFYLSSYFCLTSREYKNSLDQLDLAYQKLSSRVNELISSRDSTTEEVLIDFFESLDSFLQHLSFVLDEKSIELEFTDELPIFTLKEIAEAISDKLMTYFREKGRNPRTDQQSSWSISDVMVFLTEPSSPLYDV